MTTPRLSENGENAHPPTVAKTVAPAAAILRTTLLLLMKTTNERSETERKDAQALIPPLRLRTLPVRRTSVPLAQWALLYLDITEPTETTPLRHLPCSGRQYCHLRRSTNALDTLGCAPTDLRQARYSSTIVPFWCQRKPGRIVRIQRRKYQPANLTDQGPYPE